MDGVRAGGADVSRDAAGDDAIHHQPVAEGGIGGGAEGFALPGEAGMQEGETGIV